MGQFRKQQVGVGQITEPVGALGDNPAPDARLGAHRGVIEDAYLPFLDKLMSNPCRDIAAGGFVQEEAEPRDSDPRFRCLTEVRFIYEKTNWPAAVFYIEHPESGTLMPISAAIRDRRFNGNTVVWFADEPRKPFVVSCVTKMCVDCGTDLSGKTLDELLRMGWWNYGS